MEFAGFALVCGLMGLSVAFGLRDYDLFKREQLVAMRALAQLQAAEMEQSKATLRASETHDVETRHLMERKVAAMATLTFCLSERLQMDPRSPYEERVAMSRKLDRSLPECAALLGIPFNDLPKSIVSAQASDARLPSGNGVPDVMGFLANPTQRTPLGTAPL